MTQSLFRLLVVLLTLPCAMLVAQTRGGEGDLHVSVPVAAQPGGVVVVTVESAQPLTGVFATVLGHHVAFYANPDNRTWRGLIGVDLDTRPGEYPIVAEATRTGHPSLTALHQLRVIAKSFPTRRLRVAGRFVDPPEAEIERIKSEAERLANTLKPTTSRRWEGPFAAPTAGAPSSNFGARSVYNGQPRSPHAGVDFGGAIGTPISAPNAGGVVLAEDLFFTGNTVVLDHGLGLYSLFAHLSRIDVSVGDTVAKGATLGLLGATGRVTAAHLHWAVRLNGARVDPLSLLAALQER